MLNINAKINQKVRNSHATNLAQDDCHIVDSDMREGFDITFDQSRHTMWTLSKVREPKRSPLVSVILTRESNAPRRVLACS